jgi:hypothetical protein
MKLLNFLFCLTSVIILGSCNGDVFIDDTGIVDMSISLDEYTSRTISFKTANWTFEGVYHNSDFEREYTNVYTDDGSTPTSVSDRNVNKITYDDGRISFTIKRNSDKELAVAVGQNLLTTTRLLFIRITDPDDEVHTIEVRFTPNTNYRITDISYDLTGASISDGFEQFGDSLIYVNNGDNELTYNFNPYSSAMGTTEFTTADKRIDATHFVTGQDVEVPSIVGDALAMAGDTCELRLNELVNFDCGLPEGERATVVIQPHSGVKIIRYVRARYYSTTMNVTLTDTVNTRSASANLHVNAMRLLPEYRFETLPADE